MPAALQALALLLALTGYAVAQVLAPALLGRGGGGRWPPPALAVSDGFPPPCPWLQGVPACTLQMGTSQVEFDHCQLVESIGSGYNLFWSLLPAASGGAQAALWGMNSSQHGYVAFGFPPDPEPPSGASGGRASRARRGRPVISCL